MCPSNRHDSHGFRELSSEIRGLLLSADSQKHMQEGTGVAGHAVFPFDEIKKSKVPAFAHEQA